MQTRPAIDPIAQPGWPESERAAAAMIAAHASPEKPTRIIGRGPSSPPWATRSARAAVRTSSEHSLTRRGVWTELPATSLEGVGVRQWSMQLDYDEETHFRALEYLRSRKTEVSGTLQKPLPPRDDAPFFLQVSYQHPHEPFHCLQRHWDLYEGVDIPIPGYPADLEDRCTSMDRSLNTFHGCGCRGRQSRHG